MTIKKHMSIPFHIEKPLPGLTIVQVAPGAITKPVTQVVSTWNAGSVDGWRSTPLKDHDLLPQLETVARALVLEPTARLPNNRTSRLLQITWASTATLPIASPSKPAMQQRRNKRLLRSRSRYVSTTIV